MSISLRSVRTEWKQGNPAAESRHAGAGSTCAAPLVFYCGHSQVSSPRQRRVYGNFLGRAQKKERHSRNFFFDS